MYQCGLCPEVRPVQPRTAVPILASGRQRHIEPQVYPPTVEALSFTSLQWAVGTFCFAMGVLMLVAPHQFNWPAFAWLQDQLMGWGVGFLAAGVGLLSVVTLAPRFAVVVLAHLWAGSLLLALGAGLSRSGGWGGAAAYLFLGLGTAAAPLMTHRDFRPAWLHGDALAVLLALDDLDPES
jgi:hypothetical protein